VDFDFTDEQYALRDLARELFERESPASRLRSQWTDEDQRDDKVWRTMAEAGLLGITVPETFGGLGGNEIDLALVLEEAGRACLPEPLVETVAIGAPLLAEAGTHEQQREWLSRIAGGDAIVTVRLGGAPFVVDADIADLLLVEWAGELHALPRGHFTARRVLSEDRGRRIFEVDADVMTASRMAGGPPEAAEALRRGAAATAGVLNGIAMQLLEMTVEHVKSRKQFDRPVGSFQAVKHKLADVHVMVESARAAAWYAAYAIARGLPDRAVAAGVAKAAAGEAERRANTEALQCHAGIGFTWEHDLHFWLKRGKALEAAYGSAREHRAALSAHVFQDPDA
jgi:alkylation response protein AidB-like acyl-CoA dehydrogenase